MRCVALRCVALRCVTLRCVALRCVALCCVVLRCVALLLQLTSPIRRAGSISYTFSSIGYNTYMGPSVTLQELAAEQLTVTWSAYEFVMAFNYHVCDDLQGVHVCEDGVIEILTVQPVPLVIVLDIDVSGAMLAVTPLR